MSILLKKVTSTVSVVALVASAMSASLVANAASSFAPYADALATAGIIAKQTTEAGYNLGNNVTRAEMAKIAVNLKKATVAECTGKVFSDVTVKLGDLCGYVEAAANAGLVNKTAAKFRPMDLVTRAEALKMLLSAKGIAPSTENAGFKDLGTDTTLNGYINAAAKAGIINKGTSFNPNGTASRGEAFKIAANAAGLTTTAGAETGDDLNLGDLFGDTTSTGATASTGTTSTGSVTTPTTVVAAGDLNVSLGAKSPANGTQIPSTGIVRFSVIDLSAGGSDISVNTVELKKAGLASIPSGTKVWFEKAGTRVSGKASFTSENNAVISFAPALVVKAGSTESLDLYVELASVAGNDFAFSSATIVSSAKNTTGSFTTPTLRTASYVVAASTFTAQTSGQLYNASSDSVELAKFTVANTDVASDTRDLKFQSVVLYQSGTAALTNLSDIVVEKNGVVVSSAAIVSGKTLTLTVSDTIKDGASAIYYVKAKINNVELTTDTYQFYLKNTSDMNIVEVDSAFRSTLTSSAMTAALYSVNGGDVKFERDTTSALSQTVAPGTTDVVLMKGTITSKSAVNLEDVTLNYTTTASGSRSMNTVYLQIGSATFTATPADSSATAGTLTFLGSATVNGTAAVKAYTKLKDGATGTIKLDSLNIGKFTTKEYSVNQNTVSSAIGSIDGVTLTVGASTLNVTRTDGLGATTLASGSKGVAVYGAKFSSTQGNPIALSNLVVTTTGTANSYTGGNTSLTLYVNGVAKSTKNVNTTTVAFDGLNAVVSTSASVDVMIKADFSDVTTSGTFGIAGITYDAVDNSTSVNLVTKPSVVGAVFTVATPVGTLAATTGDTLVNKTLLLAGSSTQKVASFKVTASNDVIKLKDLVLTGANLNALSNIRLTDSVGTVLGTASDVTATGAMFANLDSAAGSSIAMDKSATYYVVADVNSSTNVTGVVVNVVATGVTGGSSITGTNGATVLITAATVVGASHDVSENTFKVTLGTPTSKNIATAAMEFTVNAFGKNSVTLSGATFNNVLSGYTGGTLTVVRKSDNATVATGIGTNGSVTFVAGTSIDAGTSATYIVKMVGAVVDAATTTPDWSVSLTSLTAGTLDAANYPKNTDTFPLTTNK
jgi:hypothetical protein